MEPKFVTNTPRLGETTEQYAARALAPIPQGLLTRVSVSTTPTKTSDGGSTDYYKIPEGAKDLQDLIEEKNMNFSIGNIFKACYRLGEKTGTSAEYDLNKIIFFAKRELEHRRRKSA